MSEENNFSEDPMPASSQLPTAWKAGIAVVAIVVIAVLGWQFFAKQPGDTVPPTQAAAVDNSAPTSAPTVADAETPEEFFQQGNSYYQAGQFDKAITAYQKATELKADYDAAYANLGAVYYAQQNLPLAEQAYKKAIEISPNDADVTYNLGAIYLQQALSSGVPDQTKLAEAQNQINRAIELNPDLPEPYYGLGVVNQLLGDDGAAISAFEKFLELDDGSDPTATENATAILQQLKAAQ